MGLFLRQTDNRSELQTRLAEELREKLRASQQVPGKKLEVEPELMANGQQTRPAGMLLALLAVGMIIAGAVWVATNF
jgi:hypothetical protein